MRSILSCFINFSLSIFVALLLISCDSSSIDEEANAPARLAKIMEVGHVKSDNFLSYPAVIQSQQLSVLSFEIGGVLKELMVVEAQRVEKGEVLAKLDQRDLQSKLKSARAEFEKSEAEYLRSLRLIKSDAISKSKLEERKTKYDIDKIQLEITEKSIEDSVLVAPYSGNIAKISIEKRQNIQAGTPAISILGEGGLEARFDIPSSIIAKAKGQKKEPTDSYILLESLPTKQIPATFKEISLEADVASQTYEVIFAFDAPKGVIVLPGMNATAWFRDPRKPLDNIDKISIPLTSIAVDGEQKYVWIVDKKTMSVSRRDIEISESIGNAIDITRGLEPGDMIVAAGVSYLSEGMKVKPWSIKQ